MRASRLLSVMMLLQAHGRISAQALADELEVSVRTVYRDVDHLSSCRRSGDGHARCCRRVRTDRRLAYRLTGMTPTEAQAMFLAGAPDAAQQLGFGEATASAQLKLLAALPQQWQADALRVGSRFHLDPVGWYRTAERAEHLDTVAQAVWTDRRLSVRYESWKGVTDRVIEPLGLVQKAGEWYVIARAKRQLRTFRLSRIRQLVVRPGKFARPRKFDLAKHWAASIERFEAGLYQGTAVLRVTSLGMQQLKGLSAAVADAAERTQTSADAGGWQQVTIPIESIEYAASRLAAAGQRSRSVETRRASTARGEHGAGPRADLPARVRRPPLVLRSRSVAHLAAFRFSTANPPRSPSANNHRAASGSA